METSRSKWKRAVGRVVWQKQCIVCTPEFQHCTGREAPRALWEMWHWLAACPQTLTQSCWAFVSSSIKWKGHNWVNLYIWLELFFKEAILQIYLIVSVMFFLKCFILLVSEQIYQFYSKHSSFFYVTVCMTLK